MSVTQKIKIYRKSLGSLNTGQVHTSKYGTLDLNNKKIKKKKGRKRQTPCFHYMKKLTATRLPRLNCNFTGNGTGIMSRYNETRK
jgi:hypothetical protein